MMSVERHELEYKEKWLPVLMALMLLLIGPVVS